MSACFEPVWGPGQPRPRKAAGGGGEREGGGRGCRFGELSGEIWVGRWGRPLPGARRAVRRDGGFLIFEVCPKRCLERLSGVGRSRGEGAGGGGGDLRQGILVEAGWVCKPPRAVERPGTGRAGDLLKVWKVKAEDAEGWRLRQVR